MALRTGQARTALTREAIVELALQRADAEGLEAVSFRRLASLLGVTPMALYRYVASKDELLVAIVDRAYSEFELPEVGGSSWQEQLRALGRSFRRILVAHPAVAVIEAQGAVQSRVGQGVTEVLLAVLRGAGFSARDAARLHEKLARFVLGLVLLETGGGPAAPAEQTAERLRVQRANLLALPPERFPHLVEAAEFLCTQQDPEADFEFSLDLLIAGLEGLLARRA